MQKKVLGKNLEVTSVGLGCMGLSHAPEGLVMDSRPEIIRTSIEGSLKKLQTDYVEFHDGTLV